MQKGWCQPRGETGAMTVYVRFADFVVGLDRDPSVYGENDLTVANREFDLSRETGQRQWLLDVMEQCLTGAKAGKHDAPKATLEMLVHNVVGVGKAYPKVATLLAKMAAAKSMHNLNHLMAAMHTIYMNKWLKVTTWQPIQVAPRLSICTKVLKRIQTMAFSLWMSLSTAIVKTRRRKRHFSSPKQHSKAIIDEHSIFLSQLRAKKEAIEKAKQGLQ